MIDSRASQLPTTPDAGLPIASPFGSYSEPPLSQVNALSANSRETKSPRTSSTENRPAHPGRVGHKMLKGLFDQLAQRDLEVLRRLDEHRYLSSIQLQQFVFTDHASDGSAARTARRVLLRLERWLLIRSLGRRVGGVRAGSSATVWQLTSAGARLARADGTTHRTHEPSTRFLAHCLAIGDVHLILRQQVSAPEIEAVDVQVEPTAWRRYTGSGGENRWLQPDLAATVQSPSFEDRWFIEVDLGTESLPTLLKKCGQYETYRASGIEQADHGVFPLVLWAFTKPDRAERLEQAVNRSPRLTPTLYRYATPDTLRAIVTGAAA